MRSLPLLSRWPLIRQLGPDHLGVASAVQSPHSLGARARTAEAKVTRSVCPYCAVGCGQLVYVEDGAVTQIEGDPDSPISRGRLCPKGSASKSLVTSPAREHTVKYRRPHGDGVGGARRSSTAMDMIADRVIAARDEGWQERDAEGRTLRRTLGRRQPRRRDARQRGELPHQEADHGARGRPGREPGAHMTLLHRPRSGDVVRARRGDHLPAGPRNADCILIMGSNMAEAHPVGLPVGDGGARARRRGDPRRSALHAARARSPTATCRMRAGTRHRLPRRHRQPHPRARPRVPRVRRRRTRTPR